MCPRVMGNFPLPSQVPPLGPRSPVQVPVLGGFFTLVTAKAAPTKVSPVEQVRAAEVRQGVPTLLWPIGIGHKLGQLAMNICKTSKARRVIRSRRGPLFTSVRRRPR